MSARNSLDGKAKRRAERQERKRRAQLVRDTERKVRDAINAERIAAIRRSLHPQTEESEQAWTDDEPYDTMKVDELRALAAEREVVGRSKMNKAQLIEALRAEA